MAESRRYGQPDLNRRHRDEGPASFPLDDGRVKNYEGRMTGIEPVLQGPQP